MITLKACNKWTTIYYTAEALYFICCPLPRERLYKNQKLLTSYFFSFSEHTIEEKYFNYEKIRLWDFDIFIHFEASWIHLCYFRGDVCMCVYMLVCVCVCEWTRYRLNGTSDWAQIFLCILLVAVGQTLLILVNIGCIYIYFFFTGVQERIFMH